MPRPHRVQAAGVVYHVYARATGTELLHRDDADRLRFLSILAAIVEKHRLELHFAVVLSTHHHLLITTTRPNIAAAMQHLSGVYCQSYNRRHGRKGHLVAGRYGTQLVESEAHGIHLTTYLALNPVRAGLVDRPEAWPWSTYAGLIGLAPEWTCVNPGFLLTQFAANRTEARRCLREYVESVRLADGLVA
jgi:REP-associated tyrosine transposase